MVDLEQQSGLPLSRTRWHRHHSAEETYEHGSRPSLSREADLQWAGSRETNLASGRGRTFFLTSLFIELIELVSDCKALVSSDFCTTIQDKYSNYPIPALPGQELSIGFPNKL
jgi:hypothetical protein